MKYDDDYKKMADAIRFLSMDAIENVNSGHPGLPMGMADVVTALFTQCMVFDPQCPYWPNRDRFVLSAGHGSMLYYALLYLLGYQDVTIEDIKNFRTIGSKTAGHPEYGSCAGIEATTGPLGQGIANAVGMAIAERKLREEFGDVLIDHYTYVLVGDGCLMEGISQEAISFAGHLGLSKLIVLWDNNGISIDGPISLADSTDQYARFRASGWNTLSVNGHDHHAITSTLRKAQLSDKPTMIACETVIGFGSPNRAGTNKVHGSALGQEEIKATRKALNWDLDPFFIPDDIMKKWRLAGLRSSQTRADWQERLSSMKSSIRKEFERRFSDALPDCFDNAFINLKKKFEHSKPMIATRKSSELVLEVVNDCLPELIGGSADLTGSNGTKTSQMKAISKSDFSGRYLHYGVREHAMAAAMNGIALHKGLAPYSGTFMVFSDYSRPAIRLASLMGIRVIHVLTHDSIGLGEDGPTHQPVEHLAALRAIPDLLVLRPADSIETLECWQVALKEKNRPSVLSLSRQNLPFLRTQYESNNLCALGAYDYISTPNAQVTIFSSGSELKIAVEACEILSSRNISTRVVSVPCFELFFEQSDSYRAQIIGSSPIKIAIEAGLRQGWDAFIGSDGSFIGMQGFGASGSCDLLYQHFGINAIAIVDMVERKLSV
ncbi:transketolase [Candidatus Liberibacter asiaticus]|nr:transketolase [Candidatus Liberibacter asiaticus]AGH16907.1 transketolase [Candidatus Liberibacter asiaticus str. gxpsy]ALK07782.1 transketolase [Candidatus Liberibacter asiaticus]ASK53260.1 transketolase [Candidatus Liberibacter asiaticus]AWL14559.1 transketolase [Candidatus Liberibacter asiaticus]KIH96319.1 transketolase [Candidatus Liberibacter asiaticus]